MQEYNKTNTTSWIALIGLSLANFLGCLDFTIVNTGLPAIQNQLSASVPELQWVINSFMLALSATMVIMGRVADIYGRKKILFIGMMLFGLSSLGAGLASNIEMLIMFRFIQGLSVAILYTVPMALVASLFPESQQGRAMGILVGIAGFGLALGPAIGGILIDLLNWRWIFFVNLPVILISFLLCNKTLTESKSHEHGNTIDWKGFILILIAFPTIIFATVNCSEWGPTSFKTILFYTIGLLSLVYLYFTEKNHPSPIISFKLFANRLYLMGISANFVLAFCYATVFFLMPLYLHNILNLQAYQIGLTILPASLMVALLSPIVGIMIDKFGVKLILIFAFLLMAISAYMQSYFTMHTSLYFIVVASIVFGSTWACILSPSLNTALSSVPMSVSGVAMGSLGTLHNFGGALGLAIAIIFYGYAKSNVIDTATNTILHAYQNNMYLLIVLSIGILISLSLTPNKNNN